MSLLTDLAGYLSVLLDHERPTIDCVRFFGSSNELLAVATNGHVLVTITVLGDFSHVGDALLPGDIARAIGVRDWAANPWDDPDELEDLEAEPHLRPAGSHFLTLAEICRVMPPSKAPARAMGFFRGPALAKLANVVARVGVPVQLSGSEDLQEGLRVDSEPACLTSGGEMVWLSGVVLPCRPPEPLRAGRDG